MSYPVTGEEGYWLAFQFTDNDWSTRITERGRYRPFFNVFQSGHRIQARTTDDC
jgi:hypothetical protein